MSITKRTHLPSVSVIILNYNGIKDTRACVQSVLATKYPNFRIVVVDNGSTSDDIGILSKEFESKKIRWKKFRKNYGFAGAHNKIVKEIRTKYVALLNNDTVVDRLWLQTLVQYIEHHRNVAVCQSKILSYSKTGYYEYAGAAGGLVDRLGYPYARGRIGFHLEKDIGQYDNIHEIFWASGTAMLIRRSVIGRAGLFDDDLHSYVEEQDFCWRVKKAGYKVIFIPASVVRHKGLSSWGKYPTKKTFLIHRNNLIVLMEHLSFRRLVWVLPLRMIMDYASIIYYISTARVDFVLPVLKAHISIIESLPVIIRKRRHKFWNRNRETVEKEMWPTSIMWEYFIRGKRKYTELFGKTSEAPAMFYGDMNVNVSVKSKK